MRRAVVLILVGVLDLVGVLFLAACGGDEKDAATTSAASTTAPRGGPIVIREKLIVAAEEHSEPIATGTILAGPRSRARRSAPAGRSWILTRASIPRWRRT